MISPVYSPLWLWHICIQAQTYLFSPALMSNRFVAKAFIHDKGNGLIYLAFEVEMANKFTQYAWSASSHPSVFLFFLYYLGSSSLIAGHYLKALMNFMY